MQLVAYGAHDAHFINNPPLATFLNNNKEFKKKKLENKKCTEENCNICYENVEVYKCDHCVFLVCECCYIKMKDYKCAHCKNNF